MQSTRPVFTKTARLRNVLPLFAASAIVMLLLIAIQHEGLHIALIRFESLVGQTARVESFELRDLPNAPTYERRVFAWIAKHKATIKAESQRWRVTPIAIAGVIAYEAIENPIPAGMQRFVRFSGPGKVHYKEFHTVEGDPVARQIERAGALPRQTVEGRERILRTPEGAVTYIAAIMDQFSRIAAAHGQPLRCRPDLLATFFNGWDLPGAKQFFEVSRHRRLRASVVGIWVHENAAHLANAMNLKGARQCGF